MQASLARGSGVSKGGREDSDGHRTGTEGSDLLNMAQTESACLIGRAALSFLHFGAPHVGCFGTSHAKGPRPLQRGEQEAGRGGRRLEGSTALTCTQPGWVLSSPRPAIIAVHPPLGAAAVA